MQNNNEISEQVECGREFMKNNKEAFLVLAGSAKLRINWNERYYYCSHDGCSGGTLHDVKIVNENNETILDIGDGGCFGSHLSQPEDAVEYILKQLGFSVEMNYTYGEQE